MPSAVSSAALQPATLEFAPDGTPVSSAYGDVYHSAHGGPAQARHVFLAGNELPGRWAGRASFTLLETGFGLGLNFLATWVAWPVSEATWPGIFERIPAAYARFVAAIARFEPVRVLAGGPGVAAAARPLLDAACTDAGSRHVVELIDIRLHRESWRRLPHPRSG